MALSLLLSAACAGDGTVGPGGASGPPAPPPALIGAWRRIVLIETDGDLHRWTTIWRFEEDRTCRQQLETLSAAEGFPRTETRDCEYLAGAFELTVTFDGVAEPVRFEYELPGFTGDRLLLDGLEFERIDG